MELSRLFFLQFFKVPECQTLRIMFGSLIFPFELRRLHCVYLDDKWACFCLGCFQINMAVSSISGTSLLQPRSSVMTSSVSCPFHIMWDCTNLPGKHSLILFKCFIRNTHMINIHELQFFDNTNITLMTLWFFLQFAKRNENLVFRMQLVVLNENWHLLARELKYYIDRKLMNIFLC